MLQFRKASEIFGGFFYWQNAKKMLDLFTL